MYWNFPPPAYRNTTIFLIAATAAVTPSRAPQPMMFWKPAAPARAPKLEPASLASAARPPARWPRRRHLNGGDGDDVLIDGDENDTLNGGSGDNQYLVGAGISTITGRSGLDVVFLDQNKADVSGLSSCKRSNCSLTYSTNGTTASATAAGVELLTFRDGRYDITN